MDKPRILAIDDEIGFVELMKSYFEPRGYEIDVAVRGAKGVEIAMDIDPDVILLDLKMPGIDGDELLQLIRSKKMKAKIIYISAYDDGGKTRERLLRNGAYAYFDKPISSLKDLESTILKAYKES
ncbi:MAG: response regulator [Candidatus Omnitrophota bacterium]